MSALRPIALGYASSPDRVGIGHWTRWHDTIETHAVRAGMPLLKVFTDDHTSNGDGLAALIHALHSRQINVILVPALEHLSASRDGTENLIRHLLSLHFGVTVEVVAAGNDQLSRAASGPWLSGLG